MKKTLLLFIFAMTSGLIFAQNSLIDGAITGSVTAPTYNFEFVYDGTDLVLVTASYSTGYLYAIDFNHTTDVGVHDWESNNVPNVMENIAGILGTAKTSLSIWDMEVNPKTKAVYLLVFNSEASLTFLFEVKNPSSITMIELDDVTYSRVQYTLEGNFIHDMEWSQEENKLYYTQGDFTLDASIGYVDMPFVHNSEGSINATSVFKSNWGGGYFTNAPLEKLSVTSVNGENRILGVTTCAPGFSIPTSVVNDATEIISVTEEFNVLFDRPLQVVAVTQTSVWGTATYLFDMHEHIDEGTQILRIGEVYLTGAVTDTNGVSHLLRNGSGNVDPAYSDDEVKEMAIGYEMIAFYSNYALMVVDDNDVLRLMDVTSEYLSAEESNQLDVFEVKPIPSSQFIRLSYQTETSAEYQVINTQGKVVQEGIYSNNQIDIQALPQGNYIISLSENDQLIGTSKFIKQ